ncbi:hypothetical protein O181_023878 [Austropuccinia psidii MF-1]|uniref:Uncharacterized protein n=1 Tax=Austropuccinia psidii MF-1 TaxID=1389203 RepID=A0A9Q3GXP6_9BASI|nr:hypothetical protein [Austropuccinia psidii MF-1]
MPCEQTPRQPTQGLSGTQWSEEFFGSKQKALPFLNLTFKSSELTLPMFVEPSQQDEPPICSPTPPIPGLSQASDSQLPSHENNSNLGPEPEVAPMQ